MRIMDKFNQGVDIVLCVGFGVAKRYSRALSARLESTLSWFLALQALAMDDRLSAVSYQGAFPAEMIQGSSVVA